MSVDDVLRAFWRAVAGPWIRLWQGLRTGWRRLIKMAGLVVVLIMATGSAAFAAGGPSSLSWIRISDSHGVEIWQYQLSLDSGGATSPGKMFWSAMTAMPWELYRGLVAFAAWLVDWTVTFEWLDWLVSPVMALGDGLHHLVGQFGATTTFLTIAAAAAVIWMARGRWSTGIFELVMSLVIASLAVGVLANPVQLIAGEGGLLYGARDVGVEVAEGLDPTQAATGTEPLVDDNPYGYPYVMMTQCGASAGFSQVESLDDLSAASTCHLRPVKGTGGSANVCALYDPAAVLAHREEITKQIDEGGLGKTHTYDTPTFDAAGQITASGYISRPELVIKGFNVRCPGADQLVENSKPAKMIVDTFLRQPHQLINFGVLLDGTECEDAYQAAVSKGPYSNEDKIRDAVGDCNEDAGEVAENPNSSMATSVWFLLPAALALLGLAIILCLAVVIAGVYALYQALKMIIALVVAVLPGGARGSLWMTFAETLMSLVLVVFSMVFLTGYMLLIQALFAQGGGMKTFFIVDILMVVGIIVYWKGRTHIKESAERLAAAMSKRPGAAGPSRLPSPSRMSPANAYYKSRLAMGAGAAIAGIAGVPVGLAYKGGKLLGKGLSNQKPSALSGPGAGAQPPAPAGDRLMVRLGAGSSGAPRLGLPSPVGPRPQGGPTAGSAGPRRHAIEGRLRALSTGPTAAGSRTLRTPQGPRPTGPGHKTGPAAHVVAGTVVSSRPADADPAARLQERLGRGRQRATPMGSGATSGMS